MVDITPSNSLLAALASQFAAARQGQGPGSSSAIPGLGGVGGQESAPSTPTSVSAGGGIPGTATTGPSVANALVGGGGAQFLGDPISQGVAGTLLGRGEPGERGDLGAGVTGGNIGALLSVLGGIGAVPTILASLVASDASGLPLDPSLLSTGSLADLVSSSDSTPGQSLRTIPQGPTTQFPGVTANTIRSGTFNPTFNESSREEIDRGRSPGAGPNRGASGAGNRGR